MVFVTTSPVPAVWSHIETKELTGSAAEIVFTGIANDFTHLMIVGRLKTDVAGVIDNVRVQYNGDTTVTNYNHGHIRRTTTTVAGAQVNDDRVFYCNGAGSTADHFTNVVGYITNMTGTMHDYQWMSQSKDQAQYNGGVWGNTDIISSIRFYTGSNFIAKSKLVLLGMKK